MCSYENPGRRGSVLDLNSDLQQAQVELLSAQCAVHQLRLHYSSDDLARFGRPDVVRKSAAAANSLQQFYAEIESRLTPAEPDCPVVEPTSAQVEQAVEWLSQYLLQQHAHYAPVAGPLSPGQKALMWPFFSPELLDQVLVLELHGARVAIPDFFSQVRAQGFEPPAIAHMDSLTFLDVIVFNQQFSERALFHALVHAVQIQVLGLRRYAELWVGSFVKTRAHFMVPLEVQAFSLASKFSRPTPERFSVEEQVVRWLSEDRY
jgi:hypothetical protein